MTGSVLPMLVRPIIGNYSSLGPCFIILGSVLLAACPSGYEKFSTGLIEGISDAQNSSIGVVTSTSSDPTGTTTTTTTMDTHEASASGDATNTADSWSDTSGGTSCDVWLQNCPEGQKCTPYSQDGHGDWDSLRCVPITPTPKNAGEPCVFLDNDYFSGIDNCDRGLSCWSDGPEWTYICMPLCEGTSEAPLCAPGYSCLINSAGVLPICLPDCDPVAQNCLVAGHRCVPDPENTKLFKCEPDSSGMQGAVFDLCLDTSQCDPGTLCMSNASMECGMSSCCVPFCLVGKDDCPGVGQVCQPWYQNVPAPPGLAHVGICTLP